MGQPHRIYGVKGYVGQPHRIYGAEGFNGVITALSARGRC